MNNSDTEQSISNMYAETAENLVKNPLFQHTEAKNNEAKILNNLSASERKIMRIEEHVTILKNTIQSQNNKIITLERLVKQLEQKINSLELYTNRY